MTTCPSIGTRALLAAAAFVWLTALFSPRADAQCAFNETFTSAFGPGWSGPVLTQASGVTWSISGGLLNVSAIAAAAPPACSPPWATAAFEYPLAAADDFQVSATVRWGQTSPAVSDMQHLWIELLDASGQIVAVTGYTDNWVGHRGGTFSQIGSSATGAVQNALALSGTATIGIVRSGGLLRTQWNGATHRSDFNSTPVAKLRLVFERYPYSCSGSTATFSGLAVDQASLTATGPAISIDEVMPLAQNSCPSRTISFSARVQTFASDYAVQWRRNGVPVNLTDPRVSVMHAIPGPGFNAFTERLVITNVGPGDAGAYTLVQTCGAAASSAAGSLTVLPTCPGVTLSSGEFLGSGFPAPLNTGYESVGIRTGSGGGSTGGGFARVVVQLNDDTGGGTTLAITGDACHGTPSACTTNEVTNGFTSVYSSGPTGDFQPLVMSIPPRRFTITNLSRSTPFSGGAPATVTPVVFEGLVGLISWETPTSGTLTGGTYKLSIRVAAFASAADAGYGFPDPGMGSDPGYAAFALTGAGTTIADWRLVLTPYDCGSADFDGDGDTGTDADIEAYFACLGGNCCATCGSADFDGDGDVGTDADIEAFFRVLGGGAC